MQFPFQFAYWYMRDAILVHLDYLLYSMAIQMKDTYTTKDTRILLWRIEYRYWQITYEKENKRHPPTKSALCSCFKYWLLQYVNMK